MPLVKLCSSCAKEDIGKLFEDAPAQVPGYSLKDYEKERTIWPASYFREVANFPLKRWLSCPLCRLIRECADRAELWKTGGVRCSIRPVYTWSSSARSPLDDSAPRPIHSGEWHVWFYEVKMDFKLEAQPQPKRTGPASSVKTSLFSRKPKKVQPEDGMQIPTASSELSDDRGVSGPFSLSRLLRDRLNIREGYKPVNTAVASWTLEAVKPDEFDVQQRMPWEAFRVPTRGKIDFGLLRTWIYDCDTSHVHRNTRDVARFRLQRAFASRTMRAINVDTGLICLLPHDAKYTALSYVWGPAVTPRFTLAQSSYPRTIKDALTITQKLGLEWLWVDRLCINQDDEAEKFALVPVIKDIFALAEVTIVAAAGDGAQNPLPGVNVERDFDDHPVALSYQSRVVNLLPAPYSFNRLLEPCEWRKRGWTFEEHVFSRRLLYIFQSEVIFSCASSTYREAYGLRLREGSAGSTWGDRGATLPTIEGSLQAKLNANRSETISRREFVQATEEYSGRDLTFEEDRIRAFAGLVTAPTSALNPLEETSLLLHGHPLVYFETLLTWHCGEEYGEALKPLTSGTVAPSWSWAAAGGKVYFQDNGEEHSRCCWFKFTLYEGFDVLGVPIESDIPIISELNLGSPKGLIESIRSDSGMLPTYDAQDRLQNRTIPSRIPYLHLVTVTFKAILQLADEGQHCIGPVSDGNHGSKSIRFLGHWNIRDLRYPPEPTVCTFAVVAGNTRMYIMLVQQDSARGIFVRTGLLKLSLGPFGTMSTRALSSIMSSGSAKWEHIIIA